jgi:orotidine-5'-phosphate decarboxylase
MTDLASSAVSSPLDVVMIALDRDTVAENLALVKLLEPTGVRFFKVGMSLYYQAGLPLVKELKAQGCRVFLDLKLHDIPNTVGRTTRTLLEAGVDLLNVHALGGMAMLQAATAAKGDRHPDTALLGVTILTSHGQGVLNDELRILHPVADQVVHLARLTQQAELQGVVCSPLEAGAITQACGSSFLKVTPGIRLPDETAGDQVRTATPLQALAMGATHLVIGRPVYASPDPVGAVERLRQHLATAGG